MPLSVLLVIIGIIISLIVVLCIGCITERYLISVGVSLVLTCAIAFAITSHFHNTADYESQLITKSTTNYQLIDASYAEEYQIRYINNAGGIKHISIDKADLEIREQAQDQGPTFVEETTITTHTWRKGWLYDTEESSEVTKYVIYVPPDYEF